MRIKDFIPEIVLVILLVPTVYIAYGQIKPSKPKVTDTKPADSPKKIDPIEKEKEDRGPSRIFVGSSETPILAATYFEWKSNGINIHESFFQQKNESESEYLRRMFSIVKKMRIEFVPDMD
jgi:hypothetical protein